MRDTVHNWLYENNSEYNRIYNAKCHAQKIADVKNKIEITEEKIGIYDNLGIHKFKWVLGLILIVLGIVGAPVCIAIAPENVCIAIPLGISPACFGGALLNKVWDLHPFSLTNDDYMRCKSKLNKLKKELDELEHSPLYVNKDNIDNV